MKLKFDEMISAPCRLGILATLIPGQPITFTEMKAATSLSDGNLHVQVLFDEEEELPRVQKAIDDVFAATLRMGGTITGEHGVGIAKQKYLAWEQSPKVLSLQREIKKVFDPKLLLNPGKFIPPA